MDEHDSILSASEIIKDRLYFVTFKTSAKPKNTPHSHYFSTDEKFVYESFYWDFGPLNISHVYNYCELVIAKLGVTMFGKRKIIHYTSASPQKRLNAAFLVGAYAIIERNKTAAQAYAMLTRGDPPAFMRFRDASNITPVFEITLQDCLAGLERAYKLRFYDNTDFYVDEYEYWERVENGDLNWIVPGKFLAMCGPHRAAGVVKGYPQHAPESYFDYFRRHDVMHIVRLNCRSYDASQFTDHGFQHLELFFPDGSSPSDAILQQFLQYCENTKHAIAVHCKAGLGRTGSLIGAYMVKHYRFTADEAIAWLRLCRPGSVIGHQQRWLESKEEQLLAEGERYRKKHNLSGPVLPDCGINSYYAEDRARDKLAGISKQVNNISLNDKAVAQEDSVNNNNSNGNTTTASNKSSTSARNGANDDNNNAEMDDDEEEEEDGVGAENGGQAEVDVTDAPVKVKTTTTTATSGSRSATVPPPMMSQTTGRVTRSSSAAPKVPPRRSRLNITACPKTQGDELNEIKATRRRHTRSHNLDNSNKHQNLTADPTAPTTAVLQRFVAKIQTAKAKEKANTTTTSTTTTTTTSTSSTTTGTGTAETGGTSSAVRQVRARLYRLANPATTSTSSSSSSASTQTSSSSVTATATGTTTTTTTTATGPGNNTAASSASASSSSTPSATVIAKNLRNAAHLNSASDAANNNPSSTASAAKQRNKRSIHERENSTGASKISRRYASTTLSMQQKQKEPVTSTLVVKKVMITPGSINSKTYPGPKRSSAF